MSLRKTSYLFKIAVAFVFFSAIALALDYCTIDSPEAEARIFTFDSYDATGTTNTTLEAVGATFYTYDEDSKLQKEFDGVDGVAVPMATFWSGSWHYKNDAKKGWPIENYYFKVKNEDNQAWKGQGFKAIFSM